MTSITDTDGAQAGTSRGIAYGLAASLAFIVGGHFIYPASAPVSDAVPDRLTCYLPYLAAVAAPLMIGMIQMGRARLVDQDTDNSTPRAQVLDTLGQTVPAIFVHLALLATLPYDWLNVAPLMALWFVIAALVAMATYRGSPAARAFGFTAALAPTVVGALAVPVLSVWAALT